MTTRIINQSSPVYLHKLVIPKIPMILSSYLSILVYFGLRLRICLLWAQEEFGCGSLPINFFQFLWNPIIEMIFLRGWTVSLTYSPLHWNSDHLWLQRQTYDLVLIILHSPSIVPFINSPTFIIQNTLPPFQLVTQSVSTITFYMNSTWGHFLDALNMKDCAARCGIKLWAPSLHRQTDSLTETECHGLNWKVETISVTRLL